MRVLLDHNLPARLLPVLRSWAWVTQAEHVADLAWADADDRFIWKATSTQPTVIFTKDKDFGVLSATLGFPRPRWCCCALATVRQRTWRSTSFVGRVTLPCSQRMPPRACCSSKVHREARRPQRPRTARSPIIGSMDRQRRIEVFLQAAHRLALSRLRADPARIVEVQALLHRWREQSGPTRSDLYWDEWERLLAMPIDDFEAAICADDEHTTVLRRVSPIGILITEPERRELLSAARGTQS